MRPGAESPERVAAPDDPGHLAALQRMRLLETYYRWTFDEVEGHLGAHVLDAGCGVGSFTAEMLRTGRRVLAVDLSPENVESVRARFPGNPDVEVRRLDLQGDLSVAAGRDLESVVCLDVLEHVEDDAALLRSFCDLLVPGGTLVLKVPACPRLYGSIDEASGHFRRYSRASLTEVCDRAGWKVVLARHMNLAGVLPYWYRSRVNRTRRNFSRTFSSGQLSAIRRAIPLLRVIDRLLGPPVGQSLLLVARKP